MIPTNPIVETEKLFQFYLYQLAWAIDTGQNPSAPEVLDYLCEQLPKYEAVMRPERFQFCQYYIARYSFILGEYSSAQKWLDQILFHGIKETRSHTYEMAFILSIILSWEIRDIEDLEYNLPKLKQFLKRKQFKWEFPYLIIETLKSLISCPLSETGEVYQNALIKSRHLQEKPEEKP